MMYRKMCKGFQHQQYKPDIFMKYCMMYNNMYSPFMRFLNSVSYKAHFCS